MLKNQHFSALAFVLLIASMAQADVVDDYMRKQMARQVVPGASIAVIRDGKVIRVAGYGYSNLEHMVKVKPETMFQSGSLGKQFTAALVLKLVEDGKIALDDPIEKHLPKASPTWKGITIRHLLTHTSGLADPYQFLDLRKDYTEDELLEIDGKVPKLFAPGESWSYSNMGYHVLGFLCSKVGGKFYGDQLVERILVPAGMATARIISESDIIPNRSSGYEIEKGAALNQGWVSPKLNTTADGSLYVSILDLVKWDAALLGSKPLSSDLKTLMWTPVKLNDGSTHPYGFGWSLAPVNGHKTVGHDGAWQGFRTSIQRFVDDKITVIVLTNSNGSQPELWARSIGSYYVPGLIPKLRPELPDKDPDVAKMVKTFVQSKGKESEEFLTADCLKEVTPIGLQSNMEIVRGEGPVKRISLIEKRISKTTGHRIREYRIEYAGGNIILSIKITSGNKIMQLGIDEENVPLG